MSVIFLLIPLSVIIAACFLGAFIWAVRSGQYEDTVTPSIRVLLPDVNAAAASKPASKPAPEPAVRITTKQLNP
jgi:cbb3-type cytochrome oxidase maturation protein